MKNHRFLKNSLSFIAFSLILFSFGCSKSDEILKETTLIDNDAHNIQLIERGDEIELVIEVLNDTTNNLNGRFPDVDFVTIGIDFNNNAEPDSLIDRAIGMTTINNEKTECGYFILTLTKYSPCGAFVTNAEFKSEFKSTELSDVEHAVWNIKIPKSELSESDTANFIIKIYNNQFGYTTYPRGNQYANSGIIFFDHTISYQW